MDNSHIKLKRVVLNALQEEREKSSQNSSESRRGKVLGMLIKKHLAQTGISEEIFADNLDLSKDVVTLFLAGDLPSWLISDEALDRFAAVSGCDINVFRIILNRSPEQLDEARGSAS
jgi:hypothetical protein